MLALTAFAIRAATDPDFNLEAAIANDTDLGPGDSASFQAGVIFQATRKDLQDKIRACAVEIDDLDSALDAAFDHYTAAGDFKLDDADIQAGANGVLGSYDNWSKSLDGCDKDIKSYSKQIHDDAQAFLKRDDAMDWAKNNYENQAYVDADGNTDPGNNVGDADNGGNNYINDKRMRQLQRQQ